MILFACDKCGVKMSANDAGRFIVRVEVYAAAGHIDLDAEAAKNPKQTMADLVKDLAQADPDEIEDQTYRSMRFDVCDACRRKLLANPLG